MSFTENLSDDWEALSFSRLNEDSLLILLRDYLTLRDKLLTLLPVPEFRSVLERREVWTRRPIPLSLSFLESCAKVEPGWYVDSVDWAHRIFVQMDPWELTLTVHHFVIDVPLECYRPDAPSETSRVSCEGFYASLKDFLALFRPMSTVGLTTYHLPFYGFLVMQDVPVKTPFAVKSYGWRPADAHQAFPEDSVCSFHFKPVRRRVGTPEAKEERCPCGLKKQLIGPSTFRADDACDALTWPGSSQKIPVAARQTFRAEDDLRVVGTMTRRVDFPSRRNLQRVIEPTRHMLQEIRDGEVRRVSRTTYPVFWPTRRRMEVMLFGND